MQLKTPRDFALEHWNKVGADIDIDDAVELLTQDRQDTLAAVIDVLRHRQSGWLGNEEDGSDRHPHYDELQVAIDLIIKLQALSPK